MTAGHAWQDATTNPWRDAELDEVRTGLTAPPPDPERERDSGAWSDPPYDLQSPDPRAIDLLGLWKQLGHKPPPELLASLGPSRPILLAHGVTAFHKMGRTPRAIWGMGYQATLVDTEGITVALTPTSEHLKVGSLRQDIRLGVSLDGGIEVPTEVLAATQAIPGVTLEGVAVETGINERLAFSIRYEFRVLKIQAGPIASGGARWNLYRQDQPLDAFQPLLQTILIPKGVRRLTIESQAWAREAGFLGAGREWTFAPRTYHVSLAGRR